MCGANDDDALMAAIGDGDERAFNRIVQRYGPPLHNYVHRYLRSEADAEEITSETLWRAWKQAPKWQPNRAKLSTWLFTVANNLATDHWRRTRKRAEDMADLIPDLADNAPGPEQYATAQSQLNSVSRFIDELPVQQRQALTLSVHEEMSVAEISAVLGASIGATEQLLVRARRTLRERNRSLL